MEEKGLDYDKFRCYNDEEASEALKRVAQNPLLDKIASMLWPGQDPAPVKARMASFKGVLDFQIGFMKPAVESVIANTTDGLSYSGIENIRDGRQHLLLSNHRDIILDPAIVQLIHYNNGLEATHIAVGDNLVGNPFTEDLFRSNRAAIVRRSGTTKERYQASIMLSETIRKGIADNEYSMWIAQRGGRTKDGLDKTSQGLLKMLLMSGDKDLTSSFASLNVVPVSISYEYESCDFLKARELYMSRDGKPYVKAPGEDFMSLMTGVRQYKGRVHFNFGKNITPEVVDSIQGANRNERLQLLSDYIDGQIAEGYRLWPTHYIARDILEGNESGLGNYYSATEREKFVSRMEKGLAEVAAGIPEADMAVLREIFLKIYSNSLVR